MSEASFAKGIDEAYQTGMTFEQIEHGCRLICETKESYQPESWEDLSVYHRHYWRNHLTSRAAFLVDTQHRVVSVASLQALLDYAESCRPLNGWTEREYPQAAFDEVAELVAYQPATGEE